MSIINKERLALIFTDAFLSDPEIIFDRLLDKPLEKIQWYYEKDTYSDHMILNHEIDYELNIVAIQEIIKNQDEYNKLHDEWSGGNPLNDGKLKITILSEAYEHLSPSKTSIHYDPDYEIYYDPSIHDKSEWRL